MYISCKNAFDNCPGERNDDVNTSLKRQKVTSRPPPSDNSSQYVHKQPPPSPITSPPSTPSKSFFGSSQSSVHLQVPSTPTRSPLVSPQQTPTKRDLNISPSKASSKTDIVQRYHGSNESKRPSFRISDTPKECLATVVHLFQPLPEAFNNSMNFLYPAADSVEDGETFENDWIEPEPPKPEYDPVTGKRDLEVALARIAGPLSKMTAEYQLLSSTLR